ncbi:MAG: hydroxyacid dehydrogenase [Armatimonadota bacterium]|nr:hydroxyacid dehydrogenase [Armatimonadota bacterium]
MSIHFFEATPDEEHYLRHRLPSEALWFHPEPLTQVAQARAIAADAEIISPFVHSHLSADVIGALPHLKMIATRSTGFDHINAPAAESRGIPICNVPTYGENTVAEHTFALILALSRNLHKAYVRTTQGNFSLEGLKGFDLKGKTLGVVGTGHIGLHVVRIAKGFAMDVLAYDPAPDANAAELLDFRYTDLDDLLGKSDIVTLHAPLAASTKHLIGAHNIERFKKGALLINTARGGLIDTQALVGALDSGRLGGAGLDVLEGEEVFSEEKQLLLNPEANEESLKTALRNMTLLRRPDLVITPHIAFDSTEAVERILDTTVANIRAFRAGTPQNVVHT